MCSSVIKSVLLFGYDLFICSPHCRININFINNINKLSCYSLPSSVISYQEKLDFWNPTLLTLVILTLCKSVTKWQTKFKVIYHSIWKYIEANIYGNDIIYIITDAIIGSDYKQWGVSEDWRENCQTMVLWIINLDWQVIHSRLK